MSAPTWSGVISYATHIFLVNQLVFIPISICSFSWVNNQLSIHSIIESFNNWKPVLFSSALLSLHRLHSSWETPTILGLITPEAEYHVKTPSNLHFQLHDYLMNSYHAIYLFKCQMLAHPPQLPLTSNQNNTILSCHSIQRVCNYSAFSYIIIHDQLFLFSHG